MPCSRSWARTERTVCLVAAWAHCLSASGMCARVWNIPSVFEGLGIFSKLFWSRESIVHVWVTCPVCAAQGLPCTRVSSSPLWSVIRFRLRCHWSAEFQLRSCWLAAVSCIPPRTDLPTRDFVYIESSVFCWIFPQMCSSVLISLWNLSSTSWLESSAELIRAISS